MHHWRAFRLKFRSPLETAKIAFFLSGLFYAAQQALNVVLGYVFMKTMAYYFGAGAEMSVFQIALSVPLFVMNVSGLNFIHGIIATTFSRIRATAPEATDRLFSATLAGLLAVAGLLVGAAAVFAGPIAEFIAPGLSPEWRERSQALIVTMLPLVFTFGVGNFLGGVFTSCKVPVAGESVVMASKLCVIAQLVFFTSWRTIEDVASGFVVFSAFCAVLVYALFRRTTRIGFTRHLRGIWAELSSLAKQSAGFLLAAVAASLSSAYMFRLATFDGPETLAVISYTMAIVSGLSLIAGKPLNFMVTDAYVKAFSGRRYVQSVRVVVLASLGGIAMAIPLCLAVSVWGTAFVDLLFGGGRFGSQEALAVAELTRIAVWALPGAVLHWVTLSPVLQHSNRHTAAAIYIAGWVLQIVLNALLFSHFRRYGLIYSYVASVYSQAVLCLGVLVFQFAGKWRAGYLAGEPGGVSKA